MCVCQIEKGGYLEKEQARDTQTTEKQGHTDNRETWTHRQEGVREVKGGAWRDRKEHAKAGMLAPKQAGMLAENKQKAGHLRLGTCL